jgi:hypothetical protein
VAPFTHIHLRGIVVLLKVTVAARTIPGGRHVRWIMAQIAGLFMMIIMRVESREYIMAGCAGVEL